MVFDRTVIDTIEPSDESVTLRTPEGFQIHAQHVVMAAGYASQKWLKQSVAKNRSSYAFITDPIAKSDLGLLASTMVWEPARPYLYIRTTGDGRLLVGKWCVYRHGHAGLAPAPHSLGRRCRPLELKDLG